MSSPALPDFATARTAFHHVVPSDDLSRRNGLIELEDRSCLLVARLAGLRAPQPGSTSCTAVALMGENRFGLPGILDCAVELQLLVVSVEYRPAPGRPHPVPVEDSYAGLLWSFEHAVECG